MAPIKALSLDLDDTLWPIWPIIERAEQALHDYLVAHAPKTALQFPIPAMRQVREHIALAHPELAHDFTAQRKLSLQHVFQLSGEPGTHLEPAFEAFYAARNQVVLYPECLSALTKLAAHWPIVAITNGNADLTRIGLAHFFTHTLSAKQVGIAKPDPAIFHQASHYLGIAPQHILHIGDDPWLDIQGAHNAGFQSAWMNRHHAIWPIDVQAATYTINSLEQVLNLASSEPS